MHFLGDVRLLTKFLLQSSDQGKEQICRRRCLYQFQSA